MSDKHIDQNGKEWDPQDFEKALAELEAAIEDLPPPDPNRLPGRGGGLIARLFAGTRRH